MGEEDSSSGEDFSYEGRIHELVPHIVGCYLHLKNISSNRDSLLAYAQVDPSRGDRNGWFKFALDRFYQDSKLASKSDDTERSFIALKKYAAMLCAKIKIRERDNLEFSVQGLTEYLNYVSTALKEGRPKILEFIDFSTCPATLDGKLREYLEIGATEFSEISEQQGCSDRDQVLLGIFADRLEEEIREKEARYFISERRM